MNITPSETRTVERALRHYKLTTSHGAALDDGLANRFRDSVNDSEINVESPFADFESFESYKAFVMSKASDYTRNGVPNNMPDGMFGMMITACLGLSGEVGELNDHIKKWLFHGHKLDRDYIKLEFGDILWYLALFMVQQKLTMTEVIEANIEKLNARYKAAFTTDESVNRAEGSVEVTHQPSLEGDEQAYSRCSSISQPGLAGKQCDRDEGHSGLHINSDQSWTRPFPALSNLEVSILPMCRNCEGSHPVGASHIMRRIEFKG